MRWILALWAAPLAFFWGWYYLSYNDMNFGYIMLSRRLHDRVFQLYGEILGMDPSTIPPLLAKAFVVDTIFILCIYAFRRRRQIRAWIKARRERYEEEAAEAPST